MNRLLVGDRIPDFSLMDQNGDVFDIKSILGKKNIVIFFYPKDGSHGCTKQACYFRDFSEEFDEIDSIVLGISGQSVESHKKFAETYNLRYPLLSDGEDNVRRLFGVPSNFLGLVPGRVTYVVNKKGKIVYIFSSQTQIERHVDEALKVALVLKKAETANNNSEN